MNLSGTSPRSNTQYDGHLDDEEAEDYVRICELIKEILNRFQEFPRITQILDSYHIPEASNVGLLSLLQETLQSRGRITAPIPDLATSPNVFEQREHSRALQRKMASVLRDIAERRLVSHVRLEDDDAILQQGPERVDSFPTFPSARESGVGMEDINPLQNSGHQHILRPNSTPPTLPLPFTANLSQSPIQDVDQAIQQTLEALENNRIDKAQIGSLQVQLHQIFLFAVSSSWLQDDTQDGDGTRLYKRKTLNQLSKLIQLLGVLSGVQIFVGDVTNTLNVTIDEEAERIASSSSRGHSYDDDDSDHTENRDDESNIIHHEVATESLGKHTTIYLCTHPNCLKTFTRGYDLKTHIRTHTDDRPYRCNYPLLPHSLFTNPILSTNSSQPPTSPINFSTTASSESGINRCTASFHRKHDLQRHMRGHKSMQFRCSNCTKLFSRKDAFIRHVKTAQGKRQKDKTTMHLEGRSPTGTCANAKYALVQVSPEQKKNGHVWSSVLGGRSSQRGHAEEGQTQDEVAISGAPMEVIFRLSSADESVATPSHTAHEQGRRVEEIGSIVGNCPEIEDVPSEINVELDLFGDPWPDLSSNMRLGGLNITHLFSSAIPIGTTDPTVS
ncbi:hypothetical protein CPB86DRAFT_787892 [Serendipita vermifera]|nr:hypothetical protein CPB86DRAFT_787892 [Serendipita vermifera]